MADSDPLIPFNGPRRPTGAQQWEEAIRTQLERDLTKPSMGEQVGDIINHLIAGNPLMQAGHLYQDLQAGLDPLSPQAAGRGLWTAMSMAGAGMPYAQRGAIGATGGKGTSPPFWENIKGVRMSPVEAGRLEVLDKLIANRDFAPQMREGRLWFPSLSPAENEVINRIGWERAPNVTWEDETGDRSLWAWEQNIRHWRNLATPGDKS